MNLARQGLDAARTRELRERALWVSYLLSAQTGEKITPAQLLGEEGTDLASRAESAARDLEKLEERRRQAGLGAGGLIPVQSTGETFMG